MFDLGGGVAYFDIGYGVGVVLFLVECAFGDEIIDVVPFFCVIGILVLYGGIFDFGVIECY